MVALVITLLIPDLYNRFWVAPSVLLPNLCEHKNLVFKYK